MSRKNLIILIPSILSVLIISYLVIIYLTRPISIFLSPHLDDAVLSAGGLIYQEKNDKLVVTFFAGEPKVVVSKHWDKISGFSDSSVAVLSRRLENENALERLGAKFVNLDNLDYQYRQDLKNITNGELNNRIRNQIIEILEKNKYRNVSIYGPSSFSKDITHPDHQILHDEYVNVIKLNKYQNVRFYFYEDFPYTLRYQKDREIALKKFLEDESGLTLNKMEYELSSTSLLYKIDTIKSYKSQNKAFMSLNEDIIEENKMFTTNRCRATSKKYCEVYYLVD